MKTQKHPEGILKYSENMNKPLLQICFKVEPKMSTNAFTAWIRQFLTALEAGHDLKKKKKKLFKRKTFPSQGCEVERSSLIRSPDGN